MGHKSVYWALTEFEVLVFKIENVCTEIWDFCVSWTWELPLCTPKSTDPIGRTGVPSNLGPPLIFVSVTKAIYHQPYLFFFSSREESEIFLSPPHLLTSLLSSVRPCTHVSFLPSCVWQELIMASLKLKFLLHYWLAGALQVQRFDWHTDICATHNQTTQSSIFPAKKAVFTPLPFSHFKTCRYLETL